MSRRDFKSLLPVRKRELASGLHKRALVDYLSPRMAFDVHTLYFAASIICATSLLGTVLVWAMNRAIPGLGWWSVAMVLSALAWPLFILRGYVVQPVLTQFIPSVLIVATMLAYYAGACRYAGQAVRRKWMSALTIPTLAGYVYFFLNGDLTARVMLISAWIAVFCGMTAWPLLRERREGLAFSARLLGGGFLVGAALMGYRIILWGGEAPPTDWISGRDAGNVLLAMAMAVMTVFWMFALMLLVNQYQTRELARHMASEMDVEKKLAEARMEIERQRTQFFRETMLRELHDGIGGITATVAMLAGSGKTGGDDAYEIIEEMALEGNRNIRGLMDFLDTGAFHWRGMMEEMEDYVVKLAAAAGVAMEWRVEGQQDTRNLPDGMAGNSLRMVMMEAIHNLVRHSGAKSGAVVFSFGEKELEVVVRDDGKGFRGERQGGRGIANMRARMEEAGGMFAIHGAAGTLVRLTLPMRAMDNFPKSDESREWSVAV
jgi:signal transduction histidine kinase